MGAVGRPRQFASGSRIGNYEILELLGAGGMGEVYRAYDHRLGREVALKFPAERLSSDPEHLARFAREARLLAALNHPNIAAIYGFEEQQGVPFLVLELVPGQTLETILSSGPLPSSKALRIMVQVAEALAAAHNQGIVHRDLKPGNIKITAQGKVKVLDFGLAKALAPHPTQAETIDATATGRVMGTPAYMSPEQARGAPVDKRADLWAWGCILYEALAGVKPFPGVSAAEAFAGVLERQPDWNRLPASSPPVVRRLLRRCLEKDADQRASDAGDLRAQLEEILAEERTPRSSRPAWLVYAALLLIACITVALLLLGRRSAAHPAHPRLSQLTFTEDIHEDPAWSADGKQIFYVANVGGTRKVFRTDLASGQESQLTRSDFDEIQPAASPDGNWLLFVRARETNHRLQPGDVWGQYSDADVWRLNLATLEEEKLIDNAFEPSYSPDGTRIAVDSALAGPTRIWVVDNQGHNPQQVTTDTSEGVAHLAPKWSPDGKKIVFQNFERTKLDIRVVDLDSKQMNWITNDQFVDIRPFWSPSGDFIYFSSDRGGVMNLWRAPVRDGTVAGALQQVSTGAGQDVELAISRDGKRLAFATLRQNADVWKLPVSPQTGLPTGPPQAVISTTREDSRGAWSPDQVWIAFNSDRNGDMNIWLYSLKDGSMRQLTSGGGGDFQPNWSPDGRAITFFSSRSGTPNIWKVDVAARNLTALTSNSGINVNPFFSPDGQHIAYQSDRSGRLELWVMNADGSGARQLTTAGVTGHFVRWTDAGDAVIFRCRCSSRPATMKVPLGGGDPQALVEQKGGSHISLSPDRSRIMDVVDHKVLWVTALDGSAPQKVFEFPDPKDRIDYPVWSPDGKWVLFDRFSPQGGDIWMMTGFN